MAKPRFLIVLLCGLLLSPATAHAARDDAGWWGWLERLSGPGPFHGGGVDLGLFCAPQSGGLDLCSWRTRPGEPETKQVVAVRIGWLSSGDNQRFEDTPGDRRAVHAFELGASYTFRLVSALDAGFGAGMVRFSGEGFDSFSRIVLTPILLSFAPFAIHNNVPAARAFRIRFEEQYITKGIRGADFGNPTTRFSTDAELISSASLVIDLSGFRRR